MHRHFSSRRALMRSIAFFKVFLLVRGDYRPGTDIPAAFFPLHKSPPYAYKFPPHVTPKFFFINSHGHYLHKNKIVMAAGYKTFRDGQYHIHPFTSYGRITTSRYVSEEAGLEIISSKKIGCALQGGYTTVECLCPPQKLPNLRNKILHHTFFNVNKVADGKCSIQSWVLNLHRARLFAFYVQMINAAGPDHFIGQYAVVDGNGAIYWKTRTRCFEGGQVSGLTDEALSHLLHKGRPFGTSVERGRYRARWVEFSHNYRSSKIYFYLFIVYTFMLPLFLLNVMNSLMQLPYHFQSLLSKSKKKKKATLTAQMLVCPLETIPNILETFMFFVSGIHASFLKMHAFGSWQSTFHFDWWSHKNLATITTLYMALNWTNEANAIRKMRASKPIWQAYKKALIGIYVILGLVLDAIILQSSLLCFGFPYVPVVQLIWIWLPLLCMMAGCYFQHQAQAVTAIMAKMAESNSALREFRLKMIRNLAYAGFVDQFNFWASIIVTVSVPAATSVAVNVKFWTAVRQWFRGIVSHFQLQSIEPAAMETARKKKKQQLKRTMGSSFSSSTSSSSSMSSSTSSSSSSSSMSSSTATSSSASSSTSVTTATSSTSSVSQ